MVAQPRLRGKSPVTAAARHASLQGRVNGLHFDKRRDDDRSRWGRGTMPIPRSFLARPASLGGNDLGRLDFRWLLAPAQNVIGGGRLKPFKFRSPTCETFTDRSMVLSAR